MINELRKSGAVFNGDQNNTVPLTLNFSIPNIDSDVVMVALNGIASISNRSACTSKNFSQVMYKERWD